MDTQENTSEQNGMDRFTRNYLIVLASIAGLILLVWLLNLNPRVGEINDLLEADSRVAAYEYPFRVLSLQNGVAEVSSPRSFDVPVMTFLTHIRPSLAGRAQDDPEMMAAQDELAAVQKRVQEIVQSQEDVKLVRWVLDREWYRERGIPLQP